MSEAGQTRGTEMGTPKKRIERWPFEMKQLIEYLLKHIKDGYDFDMLHVLAKPA